MAMNNDFTVLLKTELDTKNIKIDIPKINSKLAEGIGLRFKVDTNYIKEQLKSLTVNLDSKTPKTDINPKEYFQKDAYKSAEVLASRTSLFEKNLIAQEKIVTDEKEKQLKIEKERIDAVEKERQKKFRESGENARTIRSVDRGAFVSERGLTERAPKLKDESVSKLTNEYDVIIDKINQYKKALDNANTAEDRDSALKGLRQQRVELQDFNHNVILANKTEQEKLNLLRQEETLTTSVNNAQNVTKRNLDEIQKKTKTSKFSGLQQEYSKITQEVKKYKDALESAKTIEDRNKAIKGLKEQKVALQNLNHQTSLANKNSEKFTHTMANAMKKFSMWLSAGTMVMQTVKALQKMVDTVIELDKAFTNIQMVTGYTDAQIKELQQSYIGLAQSMGTTVQEVASGANEWLRQNKTIAETNEALRASIMFSKVAMISNAEATTLLTSAMKGYKLEVRDLVSIVDKLSAVDMKSASSSQDLAIAMSYGASVANAAGISFDKYIAYIATAKDITQQSAETIGTALKSIIVRMGQVKAGVDVDEFGESLNNVETVLKKNQISLRDEAGEFRNFEIVLDEVAQKWGGFTKVQQGQIATAIAGQRQTNIFTTIMSNYGQVLDLTKESLDSAGQAQEKYDIYLESTDAKLNKLKTAFTDLATTTINSDFVKTIIDVTKEILTLLTSIGGLIPSIMIITSLVSSGKIIKNIVNITKSTKNLASSAAATGKAFSLAGVKITKFQKIVMGSTLILAAASLAISAYVAVINARIAGLDKIVQRQKEENEKNKEELDGINKLKQEYIVFNSKTNKTSEEKKKLLDIQNKLLKTYGIELDLVNDLNKSYDTNMDKIRDAEQQKIKETLQSNEDIRTGLEGKTSQEYNWGKRIKEFWLKGLDSEFINMQQEHAKEQSPIGMMTFYQTEFGKLKDKKNRTQDETDTMNSILELIENFQPTYDAYIQTLKDDKVLNQKLKLYSDKEAMKSIDDLSSDVSNFLTSPLEKQLESLEDIKAKISDMKKSELYSSNQEYAKYVDKLTEAFEKQAEAIKNTDFALNAMNEKLSVLKKQQKLEQEELKTQEKLLAVEKAREELAKAKDQRIRVFRAGKGFVYEQDFSATEEAQKNLDKAETDVGGDSTSQAIKEIEKLQALYNQAQLEQSQKDETGLRDYFRNKENLDKWKSMSLADKIAFLESYISNKDWNKPMDKEDIANWVPQGVETKHNGGFVGDSNSQKSSGSLKTNEQFAKLMKGEFVATRSMQNNVVKNFNNKQVESGIVNNIGTINLPNIQDANGFVNALKRIGTSSLQTVTSRR